MYIEKWIKSAEWTSIIYQKFKIKFLDYKKRRPITVNLRIQKAAIDKNWWKFLRAKYLLKGKLNSWKFPCSKKYYIILQ